MTTPLPRTAATLTKRLAPGWTHRVVTGEGLVERQRNDPDKRKRLTSLEPCTSLSLRLRHDDGRAAVAVWLRPDGAKGYTFESAWRWHVCTDPACPQAGTDHPDATPVQVDSALLAAWLAAPSLEVFAAAEAGIAQRKAEAAQARAARKQARTTDISTSATTEEAA